MKRNGVIRPSETVIQILQSSRLEGNILYLPPGRLDRKLYVEVNQVLEALGGKWKGGKVAGHVFDEDPADAIDRVLLTGEATDRKQQFQFFETPKELAVRLVEMARIAPGMAILEPSAGRGAIAREIRDSMPAGCSLSVCELDEKNIEALRAAGFNVVCGDFLEWRMHAHYDRIIANPPFNRQQDIRHVLEMLDIVKPGGIVVSVMSSGVTFRCDRKTNDLHDRLKAHRFEFEPLPAGTFKQSGTMVNTCVVRIFKSLNKEPK